MGDAAEDPDDSSSETISESCSDDDSNRSTHGERGRARSQKQRLRNSAKIISESHSDDDSTRSAHGERGRTRSQKQRSRNPAKGAVGENFPKIMKKVQSVLEDTSEGKNKGKKRTILVFYYRTNEKKKQNQKKEEEEVPEESHTLDSASSIPGTSQDPEISAPSPLKRIRKWFFL
ncbi:LOC108351365 [Phodopus roborovskii]|uniref:LOC108351365 protein n=1 Tax=Phodopus roborovskii TaxID=109678 RepID=A0AAU9ZS83_PHORO|nr:LOC108351365 [Phodopus roborovskii]